MTTVLFFAQSYLVLRCSLQVSFIQNVGMNVWDGSKSAIPSYVVFVLSGKTIFVEILPVTGARMTRVSAQENASLLGFRNILFHQGRVLSTAIASAVMLRDDSSIENVRRDVPHLHTHRNAGMQNKTCRQPVTSPWHNLRETMPATC